MSRVEIVYCDVCGWFSPRLTKKEIEYCKKQVSWEQGKFPDYIHDNKIDLGTSYLLVYDLFKKFKWELEKDDKIFSNKELQFMMDLFCHKNNDISNYFNVYDRNSYEIEQMFMMLLREYKGMKRKWWQHPRFHVHHWRISFHVSRISKDIGN